jgi:hypothetical protein
MEKEEMEQAMEMMKLILAKVTALRQKLDADSKARREERMKANMDACMADIKNNRQETTSCQDAMEANLEKV